MQRTFHEPSVVDFTRRNDERSRSRGIHRTATTQAWFVVYPILDDIQRKRARERHKKQVGQNPEVELCLRKPIDTKERKSSMNG